MTNALWRNALSMLLERSLAKLQCMNSDGMVLEQSCMIEKGVRIGEVCNRLGVTRRAVRFYEEKGLLVASREGRVQRRFSEDDVSRLREILRLSRYGFSLREIGEMETWPKARLVKAYEDRQAELLRDACECIETIADMDRDLARLHRAKTSE
jgi:DNA-binding transcriptional MerR regulator